MTDDLTGQLRVEGDVCLLDWKPILYTETPLYLVHVVELEIDLHPRVCC